jgi:hypothetical protein
MAYKQSPGKMNTPKTGAGIPSALLQEIPTKKNPNLSKEEQELLSDRNMNRGRWNEFNKTMGSIGKPKTQAEADVAYDKLESLMKAQRAQDSTFIVNNRVMRKGQYVDSSMAFKKPEDVEYDESALGKLHPTTQSQYTINKFRRGKDGNVQFIWDPK